MHPCASVASLYEWRKKGEKLRKMLFRPRMDTDAHEWESDLTEVVIGAAFEVANLGAGFLEKVYERALIHELALPSPPRLRFHSLSVTKSSTSASMWPISWSAKSLSSS